MFDELFSGFAGSILSAFGAQSANEANSEQAGMNRGFQEKMSNTAHQREVADLRAAGLNPLLSLGAGASSPSGSTAQMQNVAEGLASHAIEAQLLKGNLRKQTAEAELLEAQKKKVGQETRALGKDAEKGDFFSEVWKKANEALKSTSKEAKDLKDNWDKGFGNESKSRVMPIPRNPNKKRDENPLRLTNP